MQNVLDKRLSPIIKYLGGKEKEIKYILPNLPNKINNYFDPFVGGGGVYFVVHAKKYFINDKSYELISLYNMIKEQNTEFFENLNAIENIWKTISDIVDKQSSFFIQLYNLYKNSIINELQLNDKIKQFILLNKDNFMSLININFHYQIEIFINELLKNIQNKMIRMKNLEKSKGDLSQKDLISNIECSLKTAFYMYFRYLINHKENLNLSKPFSASIYFLYVKHATHLCLGIIKTDILMYLTVYFL